MIFWAVSCAFGFKVWKKYKYDLKKFFWWQNRKRCQKTQNFTLMENVEKCTQKKLYAKQVWRTWVKVFANNFFLVHFFKTFSTDSKSAWNFAFFDTFFDFVTQKIFLGHICTFFELWLQMRRKRLKKMENLFLWMYCSGANVRVNYLENPPKCVGGKSA